MIEQGYIPAQITGGESIWVSSENEAQSSSDIFFGAYSPENGYTLAYQFGTNPPTAVDATPTTDEKGWTLDVGGATTLAWNPGRIAFAGIVTHTSTGRTFVVDQGGVYVNASPLRVSSWQAVLDAIDAAMLTVGAQPNSSITVDGMTVSYRGANDLLRLRDYAEQQLRKDTGRRMPRRILSRYV
jgi:hypothetical protein